MRDTFNNNIAVLNNMIGFSEGAPADRVYMVPQNSSINLSQKFGLREAEPPAESSAQLRNCRCPHCEKMAQNFLYLESLIRSSSNANNYCDICHTSLQYVEHVNKSIMKVFGKFESMLKAPKRLIPSSKSKTKLAPTKGLKNAKRIISKPKATKQDTASKTNKTSKTSTGSGHGISGSLKSSPGSTKKINKKLKSKNNSSSHSAVNEKSLKKESKVSKKPTKLKSLKNNTKTVTSKT